MDFWAVVTKPSAAGVARLILLTLAAAGFLAMHGVGATDSVGLHHSPMNVSATAMAEAAPSATGMAHAGGATPVVTAGESGDDTEGTGHNVLTACLFVLLSVIAGVALHALRGGLGAPPLVLPASVWDRQSPPRAPPQPLFLSLCVFRL